VSADKQTQKTRWDRLWGWLGTHKTALGLVVAVLAAITTFVTSIGALWYNQKALDNATEQARQATIAQTSERFFRSVEQLGSHNIAVRIGAVYSFGRLMRDSSVDQQTVARILSQFIRLQAEAVPHIPPVQNHQPDQWRGPTPLDIYAALTVLDGQPRPRGLYVDPSGKTIQAPSMYLYGVNLRRFALRFATMREAFLEDANLWAANLHGAYLTRAHLSGARMWHANLSLAYLIGADLSDAHLRHANLRGAHLANAILTGADLRRADLTGASLTGADLTGARLDGVNCSLKTQWPEDLTPLPKCATH
jgi:Pentapeptide repeats (8 copies)